MRIWLCPSRWTSALLCLALSVGCATPAPPGDGAAGERTEQRAADVERDATTTVPALHPTIDDLDETMVTITTAGGDDIEVAAKVAATDAERRRGLMEVTQLPRGSGMLFLFDDERRGGFWMWNTVIELDIAFVAGDGTIHTVATMVPCGADDPASCPTTAPDAAYVAALEVPGGWFEEVGVTPDATMAWTEPHPAPSR